jgi:CHASE1-domain containing sensor protein
MISKGVLVAQRTIVFNNQKATLSFTPTFAFAPKTEIIFFAVSATGSVVSSQLTLDFKDNLPNYVGSVMNRW